METTNNYWSSPNLLFLLDELNFHSTFRITSDTNKVWLTGTEERLLSINERLIWEVDLNIRIGDKNEKSSDGF